MGIWGYMLLRSCGGGIDRYARGSRGDESGEFGGGVIVRGMWVVWWSVGEEGALVI